MTLSPLPLQLSTFICLKSSTTKRWQPSGPCPRSNNLTRIQEWGAFCACGTAQEPRGYGESAAPQPSLFVFVLRSLGYAYLLTGRLGRDCRSEEGRCPNLISGSHVI